MDEKTDSNNQHQKETLTARSEGFSICIRMMMGQPFDVVELVGQGNHLVMFIWEQHPSYFRGFSPTQTPREARSLTIRHRLIELAHDLGWQESSRPAKLSASVKEAQSLSHEDYDNR